MRFLIALLLLLSPAVAAPTQTPQWGYDTVDPHAVQYKVGTTWFPIPLFTVANTWQPAQTFSVAPIFSTLTGYVQGHGASALTASTTIPSPDVVYTASGAGGVAQTLAQVLSNIVLADNYGAVGDGTTDDQVAISAAAASLGSQGGTVLLSCSKNYRIGTSFTVPANVTLKHCRGYGGEPGAGATNGQLQNQPHIRLDSTANITLSSNSGFEGVILKTGLTFPVADASGYAGTAIKYPAVGGANNVRIRALIVGFATCVDGVNGGTHYDWNIECDANPAAGTGAVIFATSSDSSWARVRTWPWGTYAHATPTNTRTGYGTQIKSGLQDDSRLDIMDFGHEKGLVSAGNGNIHFTHIWTDNNTSFGVQFDAGDRIAVDDAWVYTSLGTRFNSNGSYSFGYLLEDCRTVVNSEGIETAAVVAPEIHIGKWDVKGVSNFAANLSSTTARLSIDSASIINAHGGVGSYIVGPAGWTSDQVTIGSVKTDLANGQSLLGGNPVTIKQIASAATMSLPVTGMAFSVTGTAAINTLQGTWGGREITLLFESTASLTTAGNITLMNATTLQGAAGVTVDLIFDQVANKWREKGRNPATSPFIWGAQQTYSQAPIFSTLTGYLKGNGASALTAAATIPSADFADGNTGTGAVAHAASPALTGSPTAPTQSAGDNSTKLATTAYVDQVWTTYTPTISCVAGTLTTSSATGRYKNFGKTYSVEIDVTITTNGTCATAINATLPNSITASAFFSFAGREMAISGKMIGGVIVTGSNVLSFVNYDNTYPGGDGTRLAISGILEAQ